MLTKLGALGLIHKAKVDVHRIDAFKRASARRIFASGPSQSARSWVAAASAKG